MKRSLVEEISSLVGSGWRLIAFESFEEDRALRILEHVAGQHDRKLLPWSVAAGLGAGDAAKADTWHARRPHLMTREKEISG